MKNEESPASGFPKNTFSLLGMLFKAFVKKIPQFLITGIIVYLLVLIIHTYLLVYVNEGFWAQNNRPFLAYILSIQQKNAPAGINFLSRLRAVLFWMLATSILVSTFFRIKAFGFGEFFKDIVKGIGDIATGFFGRIGSGKLIVFLSGLLFSFIFAALINSQTISLLLALGVFLMASMGNKELFFLFSNVMWNDMKKLFRLKSDYNIERVAGFFYAMTVGFLLSIPFIEKYTTANALSRQISIYVYIAAFILLALLVLNAVKNKKRAKTLLLLIGMGLVFISSNGIFADDGGWREAGATWSKWWNSAGRPLAIRMGSTPAFWSGIVTAAGSVLPSVVTTPVKQGISIWDLYKRFTTPPPPAAPAGPAAGPATPPTAPVTPTPPAAPISGTGAPATGMQQQPQTGSAPTQGLPPVSMPGAFNPNPGPPQIQPLYGIKPPGTAIIDGPDIAPLYGIIPRPLSGPGTAPEINPVYGIRPPGIGSTGGLGFPDIKPLYGITPPGVTGMNNPNISMLYGIPPKTNFTPKPEIHPIYGIRPPSFPNP